MGGSRSEWRGDQMSMERGSREWRGEYRRMDAVVEVR